MEEHWQPAKARYAVDRDGRIGRVTDLFAGRACLVPPGGGREWEVESEELRRPTDDEAARIRVLTTPVQKEA
ncbi:hypothetical protein AB0E83_24725 [Streptomyces sp. NPDC035033]|uniref:hypothetical protein n=1 Tax=Streptomyces sp. NPDC035033 TaxID=3155368 RepID=UPI0033E727DB